MIDRQTEFAALIGVSPMSLNRWEQQKTQPSLEALLRVYTRLKPLIPGLHLEDLLELDSPE